jgi:hypothetical protein
VEQKSNFNPDAYTNCSFCDKPRKDLRWLIAGGVKTVKVPFDDGGGTREDLIGECPVCICDECTELAKEIIDEERAKALAKKQRQEMSVEREDPDKPGTYVKVRLVELRDGEEIVRKPGQTLADSGMIVI